MFSWSLHQQQLYNRAHKISTAAYMCVCKQNKLTQKGGQHLWYMYFRYVFHWKAHILNQNTAGQESRARRWKLYLSWVPVARWPNIFPGIGKQIDLWTWNLDPRFICLPTDNSGFICIDEEEEMSCGCSSKGHCTVKTETMTTKKKSCLLILKDTC